MTRAVLWLLKVYQLAASPLFARGCCRFYPCCSEYALQAVRRHGAMKGLWRATARVCRCHPLGGGGYDPLDEAE